MRSKHSSGFLELKKGLGTNGCCSLSCSGVKIRGRLLTERARSLFHKGLFPLLLLSSVLFSARSLLLTSNDRRQIKRKLCIYTGKETNIATASKFNPALGSNPRGSARQMKRFESSPPADSMKHDDRRGAGCGALFFFIVIKS